MKRGLSHTQINAKETRVNGRCVFTGEEYTIVVPTAGLEQWLDGALIQSALPMVPPEQREFLISGISPQGWKKMFG